MEPGVVWFLPWEKSIIEWLQQLGKGTFSGDLLIWLNRFFTFLGDDMLCIAVMGLIYWGFDKRKGERIGAVLMATNVSTTLLKNLFYRIRPWAACESVSLLQNVGGYSFPSGHCSKAAALYPTTAYEYRNSKILRWIAVLIPLLCGISRCYVGAHWPTDVAVGLLTGLLFFVIVERVLAKTQHKYLVYAVLILFHGIGLFYCTTNGYYDSYGMLIGFTLGILYEEKLTRFENTANPAVAILRTIFGGILYYTLNMLLERVLGNIFPKHSIGWRLMRTVRCGTVTFILIAIYPYAFLLEKKLFRSIKQ